MTLMLILAVIGGYTVVSTVLGAVMFLFHDRDGNSGRYRHWTEEE